MLATLDPHSSFFDPREYAQMRERQGGRYYGLGIQITATDGDITATSVFEGSPAYKKGLRRGDIIAKIGGQDAKGWTTEQAMRQLRGTKGTTVHVEIKRRGYEQMIPLDVTRDEVIIPTVPAYFMIDATTGYIQLRDFGENTDRDLKHALHELASTGMRRLQLDIRNNPGGPLDYGPGQLGWARALSDHPLLQPLFAFALVVLTAIYAWATIAFGPRFSNLTDRGILTHGPYRWTKHPAYLTKNLFWWLSALPMLTTTGLWTDAFRNSCILAFVSGVYYWRARTEERHLSEDPAYREYSDWMKRNAPIPRFFAWLAGRKPA